MWGCEFGGRCSWGGGEPAGLFSAGPHIVPAPSQRCGAHRRPPPSRGAPVLNSTGGWTQYNSELSQDQNNQELTWHSIFNNLDVGAGGTRSVRPTFVNEAQGKYPQGHESVKLHVWCVLEGRHTKKECSIPHHRAIIDQPQRFDLPFNWRLWSLLGDDEVPFPTLNPLSLNEWMKARFR